MVTSVSFLCNVRFAVLELGYALCLQHDVRKVITIGIHTKQGFSRFFLNCFTNFHKLVPCTSCQVINGIPGLLKKIGTVCTYNSSIVNRNSVVLPVNRRVVNLLRSEVIPIDIDVAKRRPCVRIISYISVDVVILEEYDVWKVGIISC